LWRVYSLKEARKAQGARQGARRKAQGARQGARRKAQGARPARKAQGADKTKHRRNNLIVVDGKQLIYIKPMQLCILTKDKAQ
jgi:hypothetical protein